MAYRIAALHYISCQKNSKPNKTKTRIHLCLLKREVFCTIPHPVHIIPNPAQI